MRTRDPSEWAGLEKAPVSDGFRRGGAGLGGGELRLRRSLRAAAREYLRRCSVRGAQVLLEEHDTTLNTCLSRTCLGAMLLVAAGTVGYACYQRLVLPALEVSLPFQEHSIDNIDFPAVAICSYNLLSRRLLREYAKELMEKDPHHRYTEVQLQRRLIQLGALVDHTLQLIDINFMQYLRRIDPERGNNVTKLMLKLSRPCDEQLLHCSWRGTAMRCDELFAPRATPLGFCCVFNSYYAPQDLDNEPRTLNTVGQDDGLAVVIRRNLGDHGYLRRASVGSEVLIFDGFEYPLLESGAVRSYSAQLNVSAYLVLSAREQKAATNVAYVTEDRRGCRFREASRPRSYRSSYAWCLMLCRRDAARSLCGCVPFYLLPKKTDFVCSLNQIGCLNKYREKLLKYYPPNTVEDDTLMEEFADSLYCIHCIPDCTRIRYSAAVYTSRYRDGIKILKNVFTSNVSLGNTTVLRLFYTNEDQRLFYLAVTERWFEAVTVVGGEAAMLLGATLLSLPELLFFLTLRWRRHYRRHRRSSR